MRQSPDNRRTIHKKHLAFALPGDGGTNRANGADANRIECIAGELITEGDAVAIVTVAGAARAVRAQAVAAHYHATIGISASNAAAGGVVVVITGGGYESPRYSFIAGQQLYVRSTPIAATLNITSIPFPTAVYEIGISCGGRAILIRPTLRVIRKY